MAGFKTHITTSTVLGVGCGAAGYFLLEVPLAGAMLGAGLCSLSGVLPDLDSDSGVPVRETMAFAAAIVPMLMIDRFQQMGLSHESIALAGGIIYLVIRFGLAEIFNRFTMHRGMWHSLPAAAIAGTIAFLVCSCEHIELRMFKTGAVMLGFISHLLLDELYSIEWKRGRVHLKKSFGTALKLWSGRRWANMATYGELMLLVFIAVGDPFVMDYFGFHDGNVHSIAYDMVNEMFR